MAIVLKATASMITYVWMQLKANCFGMKHFITTYITGYSYSFSMCIFKSNLCHDVKQPMTSYIVEFYVTTCHMSRLSWHPHMLVMWSVEIQLWTNIHNVATVISW